MEYIVRLLNTPIRDFALLDAIAATALILGIVALVYVALNILELWIRQWK